MQVCHFSSVHRVNDIRVFRKQCTTLAAGGHDVTLIACPANADGGRVNIIEVEPPQSRILRMLFHSYRVYKLAKRQNADIYHFHDPELLPYAMLLKWQGRRVIYDSHECLVEDLVTKEWIPQLLRRPVAALLKRIEDFVGVRLDAIVAATPHIAKRFQPVNAATTTINNYPLASEFSLERGGEAVARDGVCYVGAISFVRGIIPLLDSLDEVDSNVRFRLAGLFADKNVEQACRIHRNWVRVEFFGQTDRAGVADIYRRSFAGVVNFLPAPNHIHSQPNKLFEYMSAGIPVICSNFPLWCSVIEDDDCGICVDPASPSELSRAINIVANDPAVRTRMSDNGRKLIAERFTWEREGHSLLELYARL